MTGKPARLLLAGCLWLLAGGVVTGLGLAAYGTLPRVGWLRPVLSLVVFQVADAPFLFLAWTETRRLRWDTQDRRPLHQALSLRTWLTLAGVTAAALWLARAGWIPPDGVAVVWTGLGAALLVGGVLYFVALWREMRQEFWDPLRWAPKIGGCTPNRAGGAGTLGVRSMFWPAEPVKT